MGTDIYLSWKGKTEKNFEEQLTTIWSINAGSKGYLRASIGMKLENWLLEQIFPDEYWEGEKTRYEFTVKRLEVLEIVGRIYLIAKLTGKRPPEEKIKTAERDKMIKAMIKSATESMGATLLEFRIPNISDAVMWLNSVFEFFELGRKLEEEGKEPEVTISW